MLLEQIQNKINQFKGFDKGTKSTIDTDYGLDRGNIQLSGMIGLFSESKISGFNFWWI